MIAVHLASVTHHVADIEQWLLSRNIPHTLENVVLPLDDVCEPLAGCPIMAVTHRIRFKRPADAQRFCRNWRSARIVSIH